MQKIKKTIIIPLVIVLVFTSAVRVGAETDFSSLRSADEVCVGGFPFGIKLFCNGLLVVGFSDVECDVGSKTPAADAGIKVGDVITELNGKNIESAQQFTDEVGGCAGEITLTCLRGEKKYTVTLTPSLSEKDGCYKTGMWLRDSTAGIGTVTFIETDSGEFAGLGHGICDADTGELVPLMRGIVTDVKIAGVKNGIPGEPGELKGYFTYPDRGVVLKNTVSGVFGVYTNIPENVDLSETVKIGTRRDVSVGEAEIISTVDGKREKYTIEITKLPTDRGKSNFEIKVTDKDLIGKTGGIVQGMSGSPVIQNGKLVGAVTHVLVNDPTRGYAIFAENMLETAQQVADEKALKDAS